ncbi:MAG: hypothetical protein AB7G75_09435 [Candidatus Binatia bacterium]
MKVNLPTSSKTLLLQIPLDTPRLVALGRPAEVGLVLRVQSPLSFRRKDLTVQLRVVGTQQKEGVWVLAVVFRILEPLLTLREGILYINPTQKSEYALLRLLSLQERFPLLFCSPRLQAVVRREISWSVQQRQEVRLLMVHVEHSFGERTVRGTLDQDFSAARQEFQRTYSVTTLLTGSTPSGLRTSGPFRGAVLD